MQPRPCPPTTPSCSPDTLPHRFLLLPAPYLCISAYLFTCLSAYLFTFLPFPSPDPACCSSLLPVWYLFTCRSVSLSLLTYLFLSFSCLPMHICWPIYVSTSPRDLFVYFPPELHIHLLVCLIIFPPICLFLSLSICSVIHVFAPSSYLLTYASHLFAYLFTNLSAYLFTFMSSCWLIYVSAISAKYFSICPLTYYPICLLTYLAFYLLTHPCFCYPWYLSAKYLPTCLVTYSLGHRFTYLFVDKPINFPTCRSTY